MASKVFKDILFSAGDTRLASAPFEVSSEQNCTLAVYAPTNAMTLQMLADTQWVDAQVYLTELGAVGAITFLNSSVTVRTVVEPGIYRLSRATADATAEAVRYYC